MTLMSFKEGFAHIYYLPGYHILVAKWIGYLQLPELQSACQFLLNLVEELAITSLYCEQTELRTLSEPVQNWLVEECFPAATRRGIRKVAVLLSEDPYAQPSVEAVNSKVSASLLIQSFSTSAEAIQWLTCQAPNIDAI